MSAATEDHPGGWVANAAVMLGIALLIAVGIVHVYKYSDKDFLCYETNNYLDDQAFVEIFIRNVVLEGDYGGKIYLNRDAYLNDKTECCTVRRDKAKTYLGLVTKPEVYVMAKYYNPALKDYMFIQRHFDPCGHPSSKPLKRG